MCCIRTSHPQTASLSREDILLGLTSKTKSFFHSLSKTSASTDSPASKCRQEKGGTCDSKRLQPASPIEPPGHINPSFSPQHLPRDPRLAAASVHLAFPHPRGFGRMTVPSGLLHAPQHRNRLAAPVSPRAGVPQQAVRVVVDIVVDDNLGAEASLMVSEWGFNNLYGSQSKWCTARGMECYGHDWKQTGVFQWGALEPKRSTGVLPEE